MPVDYDQPVAGADDPGNLPGLLAGRRNDGSVLTEANGDADLAQLELATPDAVSVGEDLMPGPVLAQKDAFVCDRCYLVQHRSRRNLLALSTCRDCA